MTKYRKEILEGEIEKFLKTIFAECIKRHGYNVLEFETNVDHVHMLVEAANKNELSAVVRTLKAVSAKEIHGSPHFRVGNTRSFWARRYGWRKIGENEIENIRDYIRNQKN